MTVMSNRTAESYVPLSRGLLEHLPGMIQGYRLGLYIHLLIRASYTGTHKGKVAASFSELALELGVHSQTIARAARWLKREGYIEYQAASNQHGVTVFKVAKYKTVQDFSALSRETQSEYRASIERGQSKQTKASNSKELQGPKKYKKDKKGRVENETGDCPTRKAQRKAQPFKRYPD